MSIEKQTLFLPVREEGNKKLHHLYHIITRVYEDISKVAPATIESINKYDLVPQPKSPFPGSTSLLLS